jgi:predicted transcriptional regulator
MKVETSQLRSNTKREKEREIAECLLKIVVAKSVIGIATNLEQSGEIRNRTVEQANSLRDLTY